MRGAGTDSPMGRPPLPSAESVGKGRTLRADAWRRLRKNKLAVAGLVWVAIMVLLAVSADLWVPRYLGDPVDIDTTQAASQSLQPPSWEHLLGTDRMSRDIASRIIYGARASLLVGVVAVGIMLVIGLVMGGVAAYYGGIWDSIIMRATDIFFAFPYVLFAIVLVGVMGGGSPTNVFLAIGLLGWPGIARIFRGSVLAVRENEYVDAARAMGASTPRILFRHIMPNAIAPLVVYATMSIGVAILAEAALSFLGMGVQPPAPSWGGMLSEARGYLFTAPWLMVYPGIGILTTVLAFVLLGDGLRDALDVRKKE